MRLIPFLRSSGFGFAQTISADTSNYNLRTAAIAAGWDGAAPLIANITIASGIVVDSTSTSTYAFDAGTTAYPDGSSLALTSLGYIVGMGGAGGSASGGSNPGSPGGPALRIIASLPTTIDNTSGTIGGGGGGGFSMARPVAVISVGPEGVRVEPIVDVTKLGLAFLTLLGSMLMTWRKMRR